MKNLFKIVLTFALILTVFSWSEVNEDRDGYYVRYLDFRLGTNPKAKNILSNGGYLLVTNNDNSTSVNDAQDFLANTNCGKDCYLYMGYKKSWTAKNINGTTYALPITNIIIREYTPGTAPSAFSYQGAVYQRILEYDINGNRIGYNDICNGKCTYNNNNNRHVLLYYTTDDIDGKAIWEIKASTTSPGNKYTQVGDLTGGAAGNANKSPVYLYIERRDFYNSFSLYPEPVARKDLYYTGTPRSLLSQLGTPWGDYIDHVEYHVNESQSNYGDVGGWTTSRPTATTPGTYRILVKLVSSNTQRGDYWYGNYDSQKLTSTIKKAYALQMYEDETDDGVNFTSRKYYLYSISFKNQKGSTYNVPSNTSSDFYSEDQISFTWSDKCNSTSRSFYYKKNGGDYETFTSGAKLKAGKYDIYVTFGETSNCKAMNNEPIASFTVKKSKITFKSGQGGMFSDGSLNKIIEGETGATYTKPADPIRTGYHFTGWYKTPPTTIPRGDTSFTAQWAVNQYTIIFDAKSGKFSDGSSKKTITQNYGASITAPTDTPVQADSIFVGWDKTVPSSMPDYNMTITAKWKYNRYKVTLPTGMEFYQCTPASDGTFLNGSTVQFKVKNNYTTWSNVTSNGSVITPSNDIYSVKVNSAAITINARMAEVHGGIQIAVDKSKAIIDGTIDVTSEVSNPVKVDTVTFTRTFNRDKTTTIVLPFDIDMDYVWGGIFCKFNGVKKKGNNSVVSLMFVSTMVQANMPYVYVPLGETLSIKQPAGEKITLHTANARAIHESDKSWQFRGTYQPRTWQEGDEDIGRCYRFIGNGEDVEGVAGTFRKTGVGAHIGPMQAYLTKVLEQPQAIKRSYALGTQTASIAREDLPDELGVEIVNEEEKTLALGTFNTVTGKFNIDRWFDLNGKLLKGKPTTKGIYFNNGKKVIVK
jgi:hypothetical protein